MKFCQSGPSSLPKNSKVAQIARELQQSPNGSPLRGRSPSPTARQGGVSVAIHSLDTSSLENSIAEQRVLVLRRIINGFKFDPDDDVSPRRNTSPDRSIRPSNAEKQQARQLHPSQPNPTPAGFPSRCRHRRMIYRACPTPCSTACRRVTQPGTPGPEPFVLFFLQMSADAEFMGDFRLDESAVGGGGEAEGSGAAGCGGKEGVSLGLSDLVSKRSR